MKKIFYLMIELIMGFVSVDWFLMSLICATNNQHEPGLEFVVLGYFGLISLIAFIIIPNYAMYKSCNRSKRMLFLQIAIFLIGCIGGCVYRYCCVNVWD